MSKEPLVLQAPLDDKKPHRNWSITINDKDETLTDKDLVCGLPGWKLEGQWERGENGTRHFQGLLNTPPVRFSAVKRAYPRAHIEVCRDVAKLRNYVHKKETQIAKFESNDVPNMFQLQNEVACMWDWKCFRMFHQERNTKAEKAKDVASTDEIALEYLDSLVADMIEEGRIGLEFIAINPMWRSSWKKFWRSILIRNERKESDVKATNEIIDIEDAPPFSTPSTQATSELSEDGGKAPRACAETNSCDGQSDIEQKIGDKI